MRADFDYNLVPTGIAHCLNNQCPYATDCLRQQLTQHIPSQQKFITIINPKHTVAANEDCSYFKPDKPELFASGMTHLLDKLHHADAVAIKQEMLAYFGRSHYYRLWRKECFFTPAEQEYVRRLFRFQGIEEEPFFDEMVENYNW